MPHRVRQCPTLIYTHEPIICYFAKDITCSVPAVVVNEALVLALIVFNTIIYEEDFQDQVFYVLRRVSFTRSSSSHSYPRVSRAFVLKQTSSLAAAQMQNRGTAQFCI